MRKIQRFPFTPGFRVTGYVNIEYSENCNQINTVEQILGMNILKNSFQYSTCTGKETPFRSEIDQTPSSKQTRSSYERKEIKPLVIFRTLFAQVSADSIRTHACSRIKYIIVFYYSEQLIANVFYKPCFLQAVQFSFGLLCMVRGFARS